MIAVLFNCDALFLVQNVIRFLNFREELRGISRGKDVKDIDWQAIAGADEEEEEEEEDVVEKPKPMKIAVSEVLKRARKPGKKSHKSAINKKGISCVNNTQNI